MQRRSNGGAATGTSSALSHDNNPSSSFATTTTTAVPRKSPTKIQRSSLRRKRNSFGSLWRKLVRQGSSLLEREGPKDDTTTNVPIVLVLLGALGCGVALLILAVTSRLWHFYYHASLSSSSSSSSSDSIHMDRHHRDLSSSSSSSELSSDHHQHLHSKQHSPAKKTHSKTTTNHHNHPKNDPTKHSSKQQQQQHQEKEEEEEEEGEEQEQEQQGKHHNHHHRRNHDDGADDGDDGEAPLLSSGDNNSEDDDDDDDDGLDLLPFHPIYRIPEAMETMGDRSAAYAKLRKLYDTELLPENPQRSLDFIHKVTKKLPPTFLSSSSSSQEKDDKDEPAYDIYHCPYEPPHNYPREWNLVNRVLNNWSPDDTNIPSTGIHQGLCQFDYAKDYDKALHYRELEQPFVVVNDPRVARAAERWHAPGYVEQMVGPKVMHRAEHNFNNHFLYHMPQHRDDPRRLLRRRGGGGGGRGGRGRNAEQEPDEKEEKEKEEDLRDLQGRKAELQNKEAVPDALRMTFGDWLSKANVTAKDAQPNQEHWYFRLIGCGLMGADGSCDQGSTEALFDELPFFQPLPHDDDNNNNNANNNNNKNNNALYLGNPEEQMGIHCRFGMKGVIAENHFDASRNAIAVFMGQRRYILSHPQQCANLALLPKHHASARHSAVDYTHPDLQKFPEFAHAKGNEVVLQPGQVLYLPTHWFHYIVSLDLNYQCNARSGETDHYWPPIRDCGF
ncbi:hypothetical protein ACA910_021473 [Epithemia clementina (nom. ined.)]